MKKIYVYLHHQGFDFYMSERELSPEERLCEVCGEEDILLGVYETEDALADGLTQLYKDGYDLLPCDEYYVKKEKYSTKELE